MPPPNLGAICGLKLFAHIGATRPPAKHRSVFGFRRDGADQYGLEALATMFLADRQADSC